MFFLSECEPDRKDSVLRTTVSLRSSPQIFACDVCADGQCDVEDCNTEVHILAVENSPEGGTVQVQNMFLDI